MRGHKVEQLGIATVGFFWCFLMWFSTAAFSPSIAATYHLTIKDLGLLASSAIWMAPVGRIVAGWAADRFGAPRTFAAILAGCGLVSIASAFTTSYELLFAERVVVAIAGVSFVVGIQHVAQWFDSHEMGTAEGLYAGTGNVGAGVGALLLPRIFGTDYQSASLWLGVIALAVAAWYLVRGSAAKSTERRDAARRGGDLRGMVFVWTRYIAIALMLAYAMSFGLEIALNAWLPGYFAPAFTMRLRRSDSPASPDYKSRPARSRRLNRSTPLCSGRSPASCPICSSAGAGRRFLSSPRNCLMRPGCTGSGSRSF